MHTYIKKLAVAGMAAMFWTAPAAPGMAMEPILPFGQVRGGMEGTAYTVVDSSGQIKNFQVDIVGNVDNGKGSQPMIMARATGPVVEQAGGILQGMSGSPVYVDGRLVGAVAAGIKDMTPYTFFITPIDEMLPLWKMPDRKNLTHIRTIDIKKAADEQKKREEEKKKQAEARAKKGSDGKVYGDDLVAKAKAAVAAEQAQKQKDESGKAAVQKPDESRAPAKMPSDKAAMSAKAEADKAASSKTESDKVAASAETKPNKTTTSAKAKPDKAATSAKAKPGKAAAPAKAKPNKAVSSAKAKSDKEMSSAKGEADRAAASDGSGTDKNNVPSAKQAEQKAVLYFSGFDRAGLNFLQKQLDPSGKLQFQPMETPSGTSTDNTDFHASLVPGAAVGVAVAYGDFAVGATGTVTAVDGKKILAFGHPFLHRGNVNYFMTDAKIVGTISGQSNGMKIASIGSIIGRISQDRAAGIAGTLGTFPSVVPIRVKVRDGSLGRTDSYGARIAYDEDFLAQLSGGIAYAALSKTADNLSGSTAKVGFVIRTNAVPNGKVVRSNMFYNTADVGQIAMAELMQAMNIITQNTDKESDIIDVQVDIDVNDGRQTASLVSAVPDKRRAKPGDTVKFVTTIKPYRKPRETVVIPYTVPESQPAGILNLDVRSGGLVPTTTLMVLQQSGVDVTSEDESKLTTEAQLKKLQDSGRNNEIVITPGPVQKQLSPHEQQKLLRDSQERRQKAPHKVSLLGAGSQKQAGEAKFATNYVIDNVIHTSLQIDRN